MENIQRHQKRLQGVDWSWFECGSGPAMVFLHGGGGTGKAWTYQLRHFGDRFRVVAPDLPGFGQTAAITGVDRVSQITEPLLDFLLSLEIAEMILAGNSMGARVALTLAAQRPESITRLLLLSVVGLSLPEIPVANPLAIDPAHFMAGMVCHPEDFRAKTPYRTLDDAKELGAGRSTYARYQQEAEIHPDADLRLERVTMPTLLLWGREDRIIPLAYGTALQTRLAQGRLVVLEEVGHLPHMEAPERTNAAIDHFLTETRI